MPVKTSPRPALVVAGLALSAVLAVGPAHAAKAEHVRAPVPQVRIIDGDSALCTARGQSHFRVDDPFASMLLG